MAPTGETGRLRDLSAMRTKLLSGGVEYMKTVVGSLILVLIVGQATANAQTPDTYTATVYVLNICRSQSSPVVATTASLFDARKLRIAFAAPAELSRSVWKYSLSLPRRHTYVWFDAGVCQAKVLAVSLDGTPRTYVALLRRGPATALDEWPTYLLGRLPFEGIYSVDLLDPQSGGVRATATIVGESYYLEDLTPGTYLLRVQPAPDRMYAFFLVRIPFRYGRESAVVMDISLKSLAQLRADP